MKRSISVILISMMLVMSVADTTYAATSRSGTKTATGLLNDVKYTNDSKGEIIDITVKNYVDYSIMSLTNPGRIVIDIFNAAAPGKQQLITAGGKIVKSVRYAQFDTYTARVVLDINSETEFGVDKTESGLRIYIGEMPDQSAKEAVSGANTGTGTDTGKDAGTSAGTGTGTGTGAGMATGTDEDISSGTGSGTGTGTGTGSGSDSGTGSGTGTSSGSAASAGSSAAAGKSAAAVAQKLTIHKNFTVQYTPSTTSDEISINISSYSKYTVLRMTGPDRLVIDIPNAKYSGKTGKITANGAMVSAVRYSRYSTTTARVVLDLTCQAQYTVSEKKGKLVIKVEAPKYKNIEYHNNGDRVYLNLDGAVLTSGDEFLKKLYTGKYDITGKKYTVTFPSNQANLGTGEFTINDDYLKSIEIKTDTNKKTTSLVFTAVKKFTYLVFTREETDDTNITLIKPASKSEKIAVIDAGHGGRMPGAIYKDVVEKELNLDIAQKLNTLLLKSKVTTYMMRDDDSHINNYERAYIANELGAKLLLSIHNNAMDDKSYSGTMTLYYPSRSTKSFNGSAFADIIQKKLLGKLGTVNRKTIERPNLVILKATTMPSTIAEIAYITNATDRANLQKESFRQKAAQALSEAVIESLKSVK